MKRKIFILISGLLLIGVNLYAADGDFIIEGNVGIGTTTPAHQLEVAGSGSFSATNNDALFNNVVVDDNNTGEPHNALYNEMVVITDAGSDSVAFSGTNNIVRFRDDGDSYTIGSLTGSINLLSLESTATGNKAITAVNGTINRFRLNGANNNMNYNIDKLRGLQNQFQIFGNSNINVNKYDGIYLSSPDSVNFTAIDFTQIWLEKSVDGTTHNYGIVLNGDDEGADIVFGLGHETKLYGKSGNFIIDTTNNVGIGTTAPQATLDVNGYAKLQPYSSAPSQCNAGQNGSIALTSNYMICACNGFSWVKTTDGAACSW